MINSVLRRAAPLLAAALLAACGSSKSLLADPTPEKLYAEAQDSMESGAWEEARTKLEKLEGLAAGTVLAQQAQLDLAWVQWHANDKETALSTVNRFIRLNPSSPALDYAMYLRGLIHFHSDFGFIAKWAGQDLSERDQRSARDAWQAFRTLVDQFPDSKYAPDAIDRMDYIVRSLALHEVHVARYYLNRGAYLAAANRAQAAVTDFQGSPAVEEALYILTQAYDRLQMTALRDDADRVLRTNYPDSRYLTEGLASRERHWWQLF